MSDASLVNVNRDLEAAKAAAYALGVSEGIDPFMTLSFMGAAGDPHAAHHHPRRVRRGLPAVRVKKESIRQKENGFRRSPFAYAGLGSAGGNPPLAAAKAAVMAVVIIAANAVVIAGAADSGGIRPGDGVGAGGKHRAHGRVGEAVILRAEHLIAAAPSTVRQVSTGLPLSSSSRDVISGVSMVGGASQYRRAA